MVVQVILKTIDIRELGKTDNKLEHVTKYFLQYFMDERIRLLSSVFAYCKNRYYCVGRGGYYVNFDVIRIYCGRCYDFDDFQQYFLLELYNGIQSSNKIPTEDEIESKIIEYYKTHIRINIQSPIIIYKILEPTRTIWIVKLPNEC